MLAENIKKLRDEAKNVTAEFLQSEFEWCVSKIEKNMERFGEQFPSACATDGIYRIKPNDDWTNGFWTGMLWLAYEGTKEEKFKQRALKNIQSFEERLDSHHVLDHHDIGFLYSLSTVAGYKLTKEEHYKNLSIRAADVLLNRFQEKGGFIQAWGKSGDPKEYRLIIDSLLNLPLLFEATKLTNDSKYEQAARRHYQNVINTVMRPDGTTFHTYYFDPQTGEPSHGATHQGNSDASIWARGQSWAVLGIPLNESLIHSTPFPPIYTQIVDRFLEHLPADLVPYWDFDFTDAHPSDKDSSSLAITACGLLEAAKQNAYPNADELAKGMIYRLSQDYTSKQNPNNEGLLVHGVYAHAEGKGVDEPNLWGDYFYMEALMRLSQPNWNMYW